MNAAEKVAREIVDELSRRPLNTSAAPIIAARLAPLMEAARAVIVRLTDLDAGTPLDKRDVCVLGALDDAYAALLEPKP